MKITPKISLNFDKNKDTKIKLFQQYLSLNICTIAIASKALNISEKNLCQYKRLLEKQGLLYKVYHGICKETGFRAYYITTNAKLKSECLTKLLNNSRNECYGL
jgi:hypothetical protein